MVDKKAVSLFTEKRGYNCAQSVAAAFLNESGESDEIVNMMARCGGGRAEGGLCGALHAAIELLDDNADREEMANRFADIAGDIRCRQIRSLRTLSCAECVENAARILGEIKAR